MKRIALLLICVTIGALSLVACGGGNPEPKSLEITPPSKKVYVIGTEEIDLAGGLVGVKYSDGKVLDEVSLSNSNIVIGDYSLDTVGSVDITVKYNTEKYKKLSGKFTVTVEDVKEGQIEVTKAPYKTTYGSYATTSNVELRGGELTVRLTDGTVADPIPLNSQGVTVKSINHTTRAITVSYKGLDATYNFTPDSGEIAYFTMTKAPDRTKYRADATVDDIDLTGAQFTVSVKGEDKGAVSFEDIHAAGPNKTSALDLAKGYVSYRLDLSNVDEAYTGFAYGRFDITVINEWVDRIAFAATADYPTKKVYTVEEVEDGTAEVKLDGGKLTLYSNTTGKDQKIDLPNDNVTVEGFVADPENHLDGLVTIMYDDGEVAMSDDNRQKHCTYQFMVSIPVYTNIQEFEYCIKNIPYISWDVALLNIEYGYGIEIATQRMKELVDRAFVLYDAMSPTQKEEYYDDWCIALSTSLYCALTDIYEAWNTFDLRYAALLSDYNAYSLFNEYCDTLSVFVDDTLQGFNQHANIILFEPYDGSFYEDLIKVSDIIKMLKDEKDNSIPSYKQAAAKAIEVRDYLEAIPKTTPGKLDLNGNPTYSAAIVNAYNVISSAIDADQIASEQAFLIAPILGELLTSTGSNWRGDSIDIIVEYYYVLAGSTISFTGTGEGDTKVSTISISQINKLYNGGVMPSIISQMIPKLQLLNESVFFAEGVTFLYDYLDYIPLSETLSTYQYKSTLALFNVLEVTSLYQPMYIGGTSSEGGYREFVSLKNLRKVAEAWYKDNLEGQFGWYISKDENGQFVNTEFVDFINVYGEFLWNWLPNVWYNDGYIMLWLLNSADAQGDTSLRLAFNDEFKEILTLFVDLPLDIQALLINFLDISYSVYYSSIEGGLGGLLYPNMYFMMDAYFSPLLGLGTEAEELYDAVLASFMQLSAMSLYGPQSQMIGIYLKQTQEIERLYSQILLGGNSSGGLNEEFEYYLADIMQFCRDNYLDVASIPEEFYDLIDYLYGAEYYGIQYDFTGDSYLGLSFALYFGEAFAIYEEYLEENGNDATALTQYVVLDLSIYDHYDNLYNFYANNYGGYFSFTYQPFLDLSFIGQMIIYENAGYMEKPYLGTADFRGDVQSFITSFKAIKAGNYGGTTVSANAQKYFLFITTYDFFVDSMKAYYTGMTDAEIEFFEETLMVVYCEIYLYYYYAQLQGYGTSDLKYIADAFVTVMDVCTVMYANLGTTSSAFNNSLIKEIYDEMYNFYQANKK